MKMIVALCGRRRSGKDTVAAYMCNYGFHHHKISQPLKDALQVLFGLDADDLEQDKKEAVHPIWGVSPRTLMQYIGTDIFREHIRGTVPGIGDTFWIKRTLETLKKVDGSTNVVISDLRFMNEYEMLRGEYGDRLHVYRVERFGDNDASELHVSEREFVEIPCDGILSNTGKVDELYMQVHKVLRER